MTKSERRIKTIERAVWRLSGVAIRYEHRIAALNKKMDQLCGELDELRAAAREEAHYDAD